MDTSGFRDYMLVNGLARKTARLYLNAALDAERYCESQATTLKAATPTVIREWAETRPPSWSTQKLLRTSVGWYWKFCRRRNPPLGAIRVPAQPAPRCRALDEDRAELLERAAQAAGQDRKALAVLVALYLGLRRSEIARLRWGDFAGDGWVHVVGKGDKEAWLPVHPDLARALVAYRRSAPPGPWLFPGAEAGRPVTPGTVWKWSRKMSRAAGVGSVATHELRHTCLATANDNSGDLRATQELARHAKPETTAGYTRVRRARLAAVVNSIDYHQAASQAAPTVIRMSVDTEVSTCGSQ